MKVSTLRAALGSALVLLSHQHCHASAVHRHTHRQFHRSPDHNHARELRNHGVDAKLEKRGTCAFPAGMDANLVKVTPNAANAGWAMSPDQVCSPGYCPYACAPGMLMAQWKPGTSYTYPESMDGGLLCNPDGSVTKPFPNEPLCVPGTGAVTALNSCGSQLSFCQTVLPGNEAMLIPTVVAPGASQVLAVPSESYWASTSAHYYLNPPGTGSEGCAWGDDSKPIGNWAVYVAGANSVGPLTYVKIGYNPVWSGCALGKTKPTYGVRIVCDGPGCNGLPCEIDPSKAPIGVVNSPVAAGGAGGADFCVVTVPAGSKAKIEVFDTTGANHAPGPGPSTHSPPSPAPAAPPSTPAGAPSSSASTTSSHTITPGIFHENSTSSPTPESSSSTTTTSTTGGGTTNSSTNAVPTTSKKGEGSTHRKGSAAIASLVVALAAACLY